MASIGGTFNAARRYLRHVDLPWVIVGPAIVFGFFGALLGAQAVAVFPAEPLRKALPFVLLFLLFYTWFQPALGGNHQPSKGHFLNQWTSLSVSKPNTKACTLPAKPARAADKTKTKNLN